VTRNFQSKQRWSLGCGNNKTAGDPGGKNTSLMGARLNTLRPGLACMLFHQEKHFERDTPPEVVVSLRTTVTL